jgi:uncharacterized protein YndB with AHSA1/START domain
MTEFAESPTPRVARFAVPPIVKVVDVPCAPQAAFDLFVRETTRWWPLASHSLGGANARSVAIEPRVGGRVFEREVDGKEHLWGTVVEWKEPHRLVFTWHVGRAPDSAQTVALTFTPAAGGTRVQLVHAGWESRGAAADADRHDYDEGWDDVFVRRYGAHAARSADATRGADAAR